ncbi:MAG: hypothetical protein U9R27_00945 [Campylobacterota bacterium]|nr:hypothetical protein [Campylobacterota bacterium]
MKKLIFILIAFYAMISVFAPDRAVAIKRYINNLYGSLSETLLPLLTKKEMIISMINFIILIGVIIYALSWLHRQKIVQKYMAKATSSDIFSHNQKETIPERSSLLSKKERSVIQRSVEYSSYASLTYAIVSNFMILGSLTYGIVFSIFLDFVKIMIILSPILWIFFHFIDNDNINKTKKKITTNVCNQICTDSEDEDFVDNSETLLRYEKMLKDGFLSREEFDKMKERFFTRIE